MTREEYFRKNKIALEKLKAESKKVLIVEKKVALKPKPKKVVVKKIIIKKVRKSLTEEEKKDYQRKWRAANKDKIFACKHNPKNVEKQRARDRLRAKDHKRLEANKLRYQRDMQNPIYARKEFLRGCLRRTEDPKIRTEYEALRKQWKERNRNETK